MIKRIIIAAVIVLVLLIAGGVTLALHSQTVLRWTVTQVLARHPGELTVGAVDGTLAGPITLTDVQVHAATFDATAHTVTLDWHALALLGRHVNITRLELNTVSVRIKSSSSHRAFKLVRPQPPHLPVTLSVQQLVVHQLQIIIPGLGQPVNVDEASLAAELNNRAWSVSHLRVNGAQVQVDGQGEWRFAHAEHLNAELHWQLQLPHMPALAGRAAIAGDEHSLQLHSSLQAPFQLQLAGQIRELFKAPAWNGTLDFSGLNPKRLRSTWPELAAQGHLRVQGNPQVTVLTGDISAREPTYGAWQSHVDLALAGHVLKVRRLQLVRKTSNTHFDLAGQVLYEHWHFEPDLHGTWRALPIPLTGKPWLTSPRGKLSLRTQNRRLALALDGTLENGGAFHAQGKLNESAPHAWELNANIQKLRIALANFHEGQPLPSLDLQFRGHGDQATTWVDQLNAAWLGGRIQARGRLPHKTGQAWQFQVTAQHINPAGLYPQFPGTLNFNAQFSGQFAPVASWNVHVTRLDGELRHAPLQASGSLSHRAGLWQFDDLAVSSGKNHLQLDGRYGQHTKINWKLDAPDLASLSPRFQGSVRSQGQADFSGPLPVAAVTLKAKGLQYANDSLGTLDLQIQLAGAAPNSRASLHAANVQIGKLKIDSVDGEAAGSAAKHTLRLALASSWMTVHAAGGGSYSKHVWQGDLTDVSLAPRGAGQWKNSTPWRPRIAALHFTLPKACVIQAKASTCLRADWQPGQWQADALISAVPTRDLQALLPQGLAYAGSFGGHLHVQKTGAQRTLTLDANLSPGVISSVINKHQATLLAYNAGTFKLRSDQHLTTGELHWTLADGGYLNMNTQIARDQHSALSGRITGELHNFQLIPTLIPAVGSAKGKLAVNLTLSGTPSDPLFDGSAVITDGELGIPRYGLRITDIALHLNGSGQQLSLNGSAHSGDGSLNWESRITRRGNHWQAEGKLNGENFQVANTPEAQVAVSPALQLKLDNYAIQVNGDVNIPHANIRPRDLSQTASVSPDQVIVGASRPPPSRWRVHAKVRAIMGKDVRFDGFGLTGRIAGSVEAVDEPGQTTTGSGTLEIVGGKFAAYGQKLNIERGRLLFSGGPISNPALDIRAVRPPAHAVSAAVGAGDQKVGVIVRGPLQHPRISLFSQPPLPQSQMLSYLLTGQTGLNQNVSPLIGLPQTGSSDVTQIAGGQLLASELGAQIGVQDVSVQNVTLANGTAAPAVFLGKYLSPRLYVSYGTVLGQSLNTLRIQYTLSARWMLEAETGFASGADLIYSIER